MEVKVFVDWDEVLQRVIDYVLHVGNIADRMVLVVNRSNLIESRIVL